ncbi:head GIN domain-containing protein [Gaetbulibacter aquiaggeris]|uniref:Head GIN domain-containing protein n=1 Tax=Gaetbulibacter aquiaggeris TaxID=1735373 RepID=A0ABW7MPF3_9FLAO
MKNLFYITIVVLLFSCNSENAGDCFQTTGNMIQEEIALDTFDKILVNRDVELILKEGNTQKVVIETGKNLLNDIEAIVADGQLILSDNNSCNYVREYAVTKVYVTSPNIEEIKSSTQYDISSDGVLTYPNLTILSKDYNVQNSYTVGNFKLEIDASSFNVVLNNLLNAYITGKTDYLNVTYDSGTSRFEGRNLIAQNVYIWNRSSNDMIINPVLEIKGKISGTGNVICVNRPPIVEVEEQYKGRLIFE